MRQTRRRRGGNRLADAAPLCYSLSGDWSSKMSTDQGADYLQRHVDQHGGEYGAYPASVSGTELLTPDMQGPAMTTATMKSYSEIAGMSDQVASAAISGGKRRKNGKRCGGKKNKSHRRRRGNTRRRSRRGGMQHNEELASVGMNPMLLSSKSAYNAAGLHHDYRGAAVEYDLARARNGQ